MCTTVNGKVRESCQLQTPKAKKKNSIKMTERATERQVPPGKGISLRSEEKQEQAVVKRQAGESSWTLGTSCLTGSGESCESIGFTLCSLETDRVFKEIDYYSIP